MYQHILVPLNGSPAAEMAIPFALRLRHLSGGELTLARVVPSPVIPPAGYSLADADTWLMRQAEMRQEAETYLAAVAAWPEVLRARPKTIVVAGIVGDSLLEIIQQEEIDILVMTTRQRPKLARWILGSTADYLVQHAPVPVLLVRQIIE